MTWALGTSFTKAFASERFILSPIQPSDWPALLAATCSERFPVGIPLKRIQNEEQAKRWHENRVSDWLAGTGFVWSIRAKGAGSVLGQVALTGTGRDFALAYWINPEESGRGIATEACRALIGHMRESGFRGQLIAGTHLWNQASARVLSKLGFQFHVERSHTFDSGQVDRIREYRLGFDDFNPES